MKFNFYFIHGWGFDETFWEPLKKKIDSHEICRSIKCLDLNFFSKQKIKQKQFNFVSNDNIFIVHSYGLNWFLKKKPRCKLLINFFGVPDFVNIQKSPNSVKKRITKMNQLLKINPKKVLSNFYKMCNVDFVYKKEINIQKLSEALHELRKLNLSKELKYLDFRIHSIYSTNDKVLDINEQSINCLKNNKHDITILKNCDHGFPRTEPEVCYKLIKEILKSV